MEKSRFYAVAHGVLMLVEGVGALLRYFLRATKSNRGWSITPGTQTRDSSFITAVSKYPCT